MSKIYYVYILSSNTKIFYVGISDDLLKRVYQHKNNFVDGFTKKYNVHRLVYFETHTDILEELKREKLLKRWKRQWKIELIEKENQEWDDLYYKLL